MLNTMAATFIGILLLLNTSTAALLDTIDCSTTKCRNTTIICYTNADCLVSCNAPKQCIQSTIKCPSNGNCSIHCNQHSSCINTHIIGPTNGVLTIHCNGEQSCQGATFDASKSKQLSIKNCTQLKSCFDLSFHCPINPFHTHSKKCYFEGNDNFGGNNMKIYTYNGWNDLEINYTGTFNDSHNGIMYCGDGYDISCNISQNNWNCINNTNIYCNESDSMNVTSYLNETIIDFSALKHENKADGYIFVGAWVLALAIGYIICGGIRHALKTHVHNKHKKRLSDSCETDMSNSDTDEHHVRVDGRVPTISIDCQ